jgi:hypothetical protein
MLEDFTDNIATLPAMALIVMLFFLPIFLCTSHFKGSNGLKAVLRLANSIVGIGVIIYFIHKNIDDASTVDWLSHYIHHVTARAQTAWEMAGGALLLGSAFSVVWWTICVFCPPLANLLFDSDILPRDVRRVAEGEES